MFYLYAFTAKLTNHISTSSTIIFKTVITNIGGGYNNRDGKFYCPKAGLYMFTSTLMSFLKYYIDGFIMKNNQSTVQVHENIGSRLNYYPSASATVMLRLDIGDKLLQIAAYKPSIYCRNITFVLSEIIAFSLDTMYSYAIAYVMLDATSELDLEIGNYLIRSDVRQLE
ncbi:hypothetical protein KUTeg_015764 [Tegillarca granosa]|uniref:C1q domain-containing protein n=1 Tax=Tegillarca granosa TaxID=220873 RepID=A0ABQ9EN90_TEGGR|nr:hypothetical protein KUTeg_015764 [Tegillarca granosa]